MNSFSSFLRLLWICYVHARKDLKTPERIAYLSISQKHSYRFSQAQTTDKLVGIRYLIRALRLIVSKDPWKGSKKNSAAGIFDGSPASALKRVAYLETVADVSPEFTIGRDGIFFDLTIREKLAAVLGLLAVGSILAPLCIFNKNRASFALIQLELVESYLLIKNLKKYKVNYLYFFGAFEKDANFIAVALKKAGVICHKVPSSNPVRNFYKYMVSDRFSLTTPYQKTEIKLLEENWFCQELYEWPVCSVHQIMPKLENYTVPVQNTLGFISSAIWQRIARGDSALGVGEYDSELRLIEFLKTFLLENRDIQFYVFLHPLEKRTEKVYEAAKDHYRKEFRGIKVEFFDKDTPTLDLFDQIDTSVAAYSSTNLERLYAGFKTLYAPLGIKDDYYSYSEINNVAAFEEAGLGDMIKRTLKQSTAEFFGKNGLEAYAHQEQQVASNDTDLQTFADKMVGAS